MSQGSEPTCGVVIDEARLMRRGGLAISSRSERGVDPIQDLNATSHSCRLQQSDIKLLLCHSLPLKQYCGGGWTINCSLSFLPCLSLSVAQLLPCSRF